MPIKRMEINGHCFSFRHWKTSRASSCVVYVHGGPGYGISVLGAQWLKNLVPDSVDCFFYDQRGAGRSLGIHDLFRKMSVHDHESDLISICQMLAKKYRHLILVCHSWGTIPGLNCLSRELPVRVSYIGLGQVVNGIDGELYLFRILQEKLKKNPEWRSCFPYSVPVVSGQLRLIQYLARSRKMAMSLLEPKSIDIERYIMESELYQRGDRLKLRIGFALSLLRLWPECLAINRDRPGVVNTASTCIFVSGEHDFITPPHLVEKMFRLNVFGSDSEHIIFPNAGHRMNLSHATKIRAIVSRLAEQST
ncbi:alpha/beta hydrolase [Alcanivorax sp.]|uniref:alpha/beta hydrolase n=1 Tax=Alcanivorax sp. TaxID=1872427 RepID=UPI002B27633B|nr:alpha/beta hydrolase [Alcanivorax sp.]